VSRADSKIGTRYPFARTKRLFFPGAALARRRAMPSLRARSFVHLSCGLAIASLALSVAGCVHAPEKYVATSGEESAAEDRRQARRASGAFDLSCPISQVRDYEVVVDTYVTYTRYTSVTHAVTVDVVEGCGQRAIYKPRCKTVTYKPIGMAEEERRAREEAGESDASEDVCTYELLSRGVIDPNDRAVDTSGIDLLSLRNP
jgi:hypothetical protein